MALGKAGNYGFIPYQMIGGGKNWTINYYNIAPGQDGAIAPYSLVELAGGGGNLGSAPGSGPIIPGGAFVKRHDGTGAIVGIFLGVVNYTPVNAMSGAIPQSASWVPGMAGTTEVPTGPVVCAVIDDPNVIAQVVVTSSDGGTNPTLLAASIGLNAGISVATADNVVNNTSGMSLDIYTAATTPTLLTKIVGLCPTPGNAFGLNYNIALVAFNNHIYKGGTGTAGVA